MVILKILKSVLLLIIAIFIFVTLSIIGFIWTIVSIFYKKSILNSLNGLSVYIRSIALSINQAGNVAFQGLLNDALIKKGHDFGNEDEAISEVLGWNERYFELTKIGKLLVKILDKIDPKHCENTLFYEIKKSQNKIELFNTLENERTRSI